MIAQWAAMVKLSRDAVVETIVLDVRLAITLDGQAASERALANAA